MNTEMKSETTGDHSDRIAVFMQQMIPHHQNAVDMSKLLLKQVPAADISAAMDEDGLTDILNSIIVEQGYQVHQFRNYIKARRGEGGVMEMKTSSGSCYDMSTHKVTCNVDKDSCSGSWYKPGFVSDRSGCCHCRASCVSTSDTCTYHDDSAGSCYDMSTHVVTCNVDKDSCPGSWYKPGFVSDRSGCCHCRASCAQTSDTCTYYDDAPADKDETSSGDTDSGNTDSSDTDSDNDTMNAETSSTMGIKSGLYVTLPTILFTLSRSLESRA